MEHLTHEELARLVDEAPTAEEAAHLGGVRRLRRGARGAAGADRRARRTTGDHAAEGRLAGSGSAAALGRADRESRPLPADRPGAHAVLDAGRGRRRRLLRRHGHGATLFGSTAVPAEPTLAMAPAETLEEAAAQLRMAENEFVDRLARYNELFAQSGGEMFSPADAAVRYHALEQLETLGQAAVRQVPHDQVLNGLLAVTRAERETMDRVYQTASLRGDWF